MKALMIQGTASGVGKSVVVAGLCRLLARNGVRVAPFKPQNMSNNAAVTADGGEIGRAQALQAFAAGIAPSVDMNPVLLKPEGDCTTQVILRGQVAGKLEAIHFKQDRQQWLSLVLASFAKLQRDYDVVLVEGAGSPAEPNLRAGDIANMGFAEAADIPVWLVGDIDCGGVFAALTGTLNLLSASEQSRVQALLINRFRGELSLLDDALHWLGDTTGKAVAGVLPWLPLTLPEEDAPYQIASAALPQQARLNIAVIMYPRASNIDDIDPLAAEPSVALRLVRHAEDVQPADVIILPGSKHTVADLAWLRQQGLDQALAKHLRYGGKLLGICGGMQMLGKVIIDGQHVEGDSVAGLGWLDIRTTMQPQKTLRHIDAIACWPKSVPVSGYEIHYGDDHPEPSLFPFSHRSADAQVWGSYVHGLFAHGDFRAAWLAEMGLQDASVTHHQTRIMASLDRLADVLQASISPELLAPLLRPTSATPTGM